MNTYELITSKIIAAMEKGKCPWQMPWRSTTGFGFVSYSTGKSYSFLNSMLLLAQEKPAGEFLTIKQVNAQGGKVKKGAKSALVCFFKTIEKEVTKPDGSTGKESYPVPRWYLVFHISDCEGVTSKQGVVDADQLEDDNITPIERGENILQAYLQREGAPAFADDKDEAYYSPAKDFIGVPNIKRFVSAAEYYSTAFHEVVHSTGHKSRLNRFAEKDANGAAARGKNYSREELVAEIGSAFLCNAAGITDQSAFDNSAAYLRGWMKHLQNNPRDFAIAAGRAEKAANYILDKNND